MPRFVKSGVGPYIDNWRLEERRKKERERKRKSPLPRYEGGLTQEDIKKFAEGLYTGKYDEGDIAQLVPFENKRAYKSFRTEFRRMRSVSEYIKQNRERQKKRDIVRGWQHLADKTTKRLNKEPVNINFRKPSRPDIGGWWEDPFWPGEDYSISMNPILLDHGEENHTFAHELGHHLHLTMGDAQMKMLTQEASVNNWDSYAINSSRKGEEGVAEQFSFYLETGIFPPNASSFAKQTFREWADAGGDIPIWTQLFDPEMRDTYENIEDREWADVLKRWEENKRSRYGDVNWSPGAP